MKAVVAHGPGDLRYEDLPRPRLEPGGAIVRVLAGGICGSDLHYAADGANGTARIAQPLVLGHEVVGVVDEVADDVGEVEVGAWVAIHPAWPQPERGGVPSNRRPGTYLGSASTDPHTQGGFSEWVGVRAAQVRPLPPGLPFELAVLAEPFAVALHAVERAATAVPGARALVSGAGPIGCLAVAALRARGAAEITATDLHEYPLSLARTAGAVETLVVGSTEPAPESYDVVIEAAGVPPSLRTALSAVRRGGVVVQLGVPPDRPLGISLAPVVTKEITLLGSQRFDTEIDEAIRLLAGTPALAGLVTHTFAARQVRDAFRCAADPTSSGKVALLFGDT